jgi:hypothetical protein
MEIVIENEMLPETGTPYARWEAGELNARDAATAIAQEPIREIEPQEQALEQCKKACREELGTLLIRVKKLRVLIAELREQGSPALGGIAARIEGCITAGERRSYPLIEPPPRQRRAM